MEVSFLQSFDLFFFQPAGSLAPTLLALVFGLMIGSFLNVVIHRKPIIMQRDFENEIAEICEKELPHTDVYTLSTPRSACPHCGHKITALENIPVISYLFLRGKCSECKAPISMRYPALELATGLLSAWLIWRFGSNIYGLATLPFVYILIAMGFVDAKTKYLPDEWSYSLLWIGLLVNINATFVPLHQAVIGAVAAYLFLYCINWMAEVILKKQGMGNGDFKLLAALGAWFGWQALPYIVLIGSLAGILGWAIGLLFGKKAEGGQIPFGPFLAVGGITHLLFNQEVQAVFNVLLGGGSGG